MIVKLVQKYGYVKSKGLITVWSVALGNSPFLFWPCWVYWWLQQGKATARLHVCKKDALLGMKIPNGDHLDERIGELRFVTFNCARTPIPCTSQFGVDGHGARAKPSPVVVDASRELVSAISAAFFDRLSCFVYSFSDSWRVPWTKLKLWRK